MMQRQLHCCEASAAACSSPQHTLATTTCDCRPGGCIGDQGLGLRRLGLRDGLRPAGGGETLPGGERTGLSPRAGGGERPLLSSRLRTDHNTTALIVGHCLLCSCFRTDCKFACLLAAMCKFACSHVK